MSRTPSDLLGQLADGARRRLERASAWARGLGLDLYLVGGAVRDLLLGVEVRDLDLVWEGQQNPRRVAEALGEEFAAEVSFRPEFLTASLETAEGLRIDLGRARAESYPSPAALPVVHASGLLEDLGRRDFSINAMAISLGTARELIDPCRGAADLDARWLRILHKASFRDDPTRILRGFELAVRRDLMFEHDTAARISEAVESGYLGLLSGSRVRQELERLLGCPGRAVSGARWLRRSGADRALRPEFRIDSESVARLERLRSWPRSQSDLPEAAAPSFWIVAMCALLWDRPRLDRQRLAEWLQLPRAERRWLESVPEALTPLLESEGPVESIPAMATLYSGISASEARLAELFAGKPVRARLRAVRELSRIELGIAGADLVAAGVMPGPQVGKALEATLAARRRHEISAQGELEFALNWLAREGARDGG